MKQPDEPPQVVDLSRYRKAAEKRAAPPRRRAAGTQGMLGSRRGAGLILALILLAMIALWLAPALTNLI
jgi:hypothetical protein